MFCDACGSEVLANQAFCGRCGKPLSAVAPGAPPQRARVESHLQLLGIFWLVYSGFHAVSLLLVLLFGSAFLGHFLMPLHGTFLGPLIGVIGGVMLLKSACGILAGWGLLRREPWARLLAIVLAFFSLIHVPFGTALGIYTLVVLLPAEAQREYDTLASRGA